MAQASRGLRHNKSFSGMRTAVRSTVKVLLRIFMLIKMARLLFNIEDCWIIVKFVQGDFNDESVFYQWDGCRQTGV
jgi:hypothetical protein